MRTYVEKDDISEEDKEIDAIMSEILKTTPLKISQDDKILLEIKQDPKFKTLGRMFKEKIFNLIPVAEKEEEMSFSDLIVYFKNTYASQTELVQRVEELIKERGLSPRLLHWRLKVNNLIISELLEASGLIKA